MYREAKYTPNIIKLLFTPAQHRRKLRSIVLIGLGILIFIFYGQWNKFLASCTIRGNDLAAFPSPTLQPPDLPLLKQATQIESIEENVQDVNMYDTLCGQHVAHASLTGNVVDITDIFREFCQEILTDAVAQDDPVITYMRGVISQNYTESKLLYQKFVSGDLDTELRGLNLRQFSLLSSFSARVFQNIGRSDILLNLPSLDSILSVFESNNMFKHKRVVYTVENSYCSGLYNSRYGSYMIQNLAASIKRISNTEALPPVLFYTWDDACIEEAKKHPEMPFFDARPLAFLFPWCQRDLDSSTRVLVTWELLKRNISIFNADADVVFFKPFPEKYMDADVAGAMYSSPEKNIEGGQYAQSDRYLSVQSFDNFGQWWWKSSPRSLSFFKSYFRYAVLDTGGSDPNPIKRWHCDDQQTLHRFLRQPDTIKKINKISSGEISNLGNPDGDIHMRILEPESFPMAALAMRGWITQNTVTLHMTTYGYWKVFGLRELGLWFLEDNATWSPNGGFPSNQSFVMLEEPLSAASSHIEERERLVHLIAHAKKYRLGFVMPSFDCKFTAASSLVSPSMERCTFEFHYDYDQLIKLNIPFIFENEVEKVFGKRKPKKASQQVHDQKIKSCNGCLFELNADDVRRQGGIEEHIQEVNKFIVENPRIHGCC